MTQAASTDPSSGDGPEPSRLARPIPDFVILGAMKAGTTTLLFRLQQHPDVLAGGKKEPNFFSREENFSKGVDWYATRWPDAPIGLRGEASVEYADPAFTPLAVRRMRATNPEVRLILIVRHPVERLRSHYRHQVQRSRERRPFSEAVLEPDNEYVRRSLYSRTLAAVDEVFEREQLLVVQTERLEEDGTWQQTLAHIGVRYVPRPTETYNVTAEKEGYRPAMLKLWETGWAKRLKKAPKPVRKLGRNLLVQRRDRYDAMLAESLRPVPPSVVDALASDAAAFTASLGWPQATWEFPR